MLRGIGRRFHPWLGGTFPAGGYLPGGYWPSGGVRAGSSGRGIDVGGGCLLCLYASPALALRAFVCLLCYGAGGGCPRSHPFGVIYGGPYRAFLFFRDYIPRALPPQFFGAGSGLWYIGPVRLSLRAGSSGRGLIFGEDLSGIWVGRGVRIWKKVLILSNLCV
jgi:hypothetical protein